MRYMTQLNAIRRTKINSLIIKLEYFMSQNNMIKDVHLKCLMDKDGFFPLAEIGKFKSVMAITEGDISLLYEAAGYSKDIELKEDKIKPKAYDPRIYALSPEFIKSREEAAKAKTEETHKD